MLPPLFFSSQFPLKNKTRRRIYHVIWDFFYISPKFYNLAKRIILTAVRIYLLLKKKKEINKEKNEYYYVIENIFFLGHISHTSYHRFREGNGNPLQYTCLQNSMDRGTWWAIVHGVAESCSQLST